MFAVFLCAKKTTNYNSSDFPPSLISQNAAHGAIRSSPRQCFLKMNYVLESKQNGHEVICAQCHGPSLTEQSWGWESNMGRFRRCCRACFGNGSCPDILTKIFIGLPAWEDSFLDSCVREETQSFQSFINNKTHFKSEISKSSEGLAK